MSNRKIILTADDYGFCDSVDDGIIQAVKDGYITSVAAFANGPDAKTRLERLKQVQKEIHDKKGILDVGCHLTITSGKPLTEDIKKIEYGFVNKKGYFRTFTQMKFPEQKEGDKFHDKRNEALQKELMKQVQVFRDLEIHVSNLSSHHNSLTFEENLYQQAILFAKDVNIPLRSHVIYPKSKEENYQLQWRLRLRDNNDAYQIKEIRAFFESIEDHVNSWKKDRDYQPFPQMPSGINGSNYGPPPPVPVRRKKHYEKARHKAEKTFLQILTVKSGETMEFCFHLCDKDKWKRQDLTHYQKKINRVSNPHYYPGVTPNYFDGRRMEYISLAWLHEKIKNRTDIPEIVSWDSIKK